MKKGQLAFIIICLVLLLIPFAGTAITGGETENETGEEMMKPVLVTEKETWNKDFLRETGDFFSNHFAGRKQFVTANALFYGKIFRTSTTDQVLIGKNNWMYYTATLNDYTGQHTMTERGLNNVTHNLKLMQDYIESQGSQFLFTIAPNKNSIYDENMPYYYIKGTDPNTYAELLPKIEQAGVHYVDLFSAFQSQDEILYLERDSHWNRKGAALAYNTIMSETGLSYETYENARTVMKKDKIGDLTEMIYPLKSEPEDEYYYDKDWSYEYVNDVTDNMDNWIETSCPANSHSLLMYRDSFGESLLPFFAEEFGQAYFSRLVPYNLTNIAYYKPEYVIIERVERRIASFAEVAAVMEMPTVEKTDDMVLTDSAGLSDILSAQADNNDGKAIGSDRDDRESTIRIQESGDFYVISGEVSDELMNDTAGIYLGIKTGESETIYDTFWISSEKEDMVDDYGFSVYYPKNKLKKTSQLEVYIDR